ncbi:RNA polymerase sigma factor [Steroidobacter sp.]|uniref:RNA polymerase sigma factor n=1 Tax=Steroidobacter sp. TaxID=1978227 RepID=UPI001A3CDD11|nr:sigma-70 family RNA polymerase sigma factor [Steroidobacter sp.]MBL8270957.1 sigma-70 family RNA polymerase sigma factor [Steroidobacter sp.]
MNESLHRWFAREICAHEAALTRYIARVWPRQAEVADLRHEVYIRVLEAAARSRPLSPKSFLFTTTRHLLTDRARRNRIVSIELLEDLNSLNVLVDEISPERLTSARQQLRRVSDILNQLPDRCRDVVWMRKVENLPQKQIAARLGIAETTVEKHLVRGMQMLGDLFHGAPTVDAAHKEQKRERDEAHDGK